MKYSTKGQVMNLTINPINSINNDKTSFKQKYIVTLPPAIQYQAKEVISKAGAASLAAAAIIIPTFRDGKKSDMEVPAKPTLESLAKSLPEIKLFDGELLFDPNNLDKAIDFEKLYDKIEDKSCRGFLGRRLPLEGFDDIMRGDFIDLKERRILKINSGHNIKEINYGYDGKVESIRIKEYLANTYGSLPLTKEVTANIDGSAKIKYEEDFYYGTDKFINYRPLGNGEMEIDVYSMNHKDASGPNAQKHDLNTDKISDEQLIKEYRHKHWW